MEDGQVILDNEYAKANYEYCIAHPEEIDDNGVEKLSWNYTENAIAECSKCHKEFALRDEYYGACQCECGQWYLMDGTEANPPEMWEEPLEEEW